MPSNFYRCQAILGMKRRAVIKTTSLGHRSEDVDDDLDLLKKVLTGDESWLYGCDIKTKAQSSQWMRLEEARLVRSNVKVLLTVFFDCNGVEHHEFLKQNGTVNKAY